MAGLGDRATGLMSMLFGGDEEQEQGNSNTPNGMGMGLGNIMTNVSNQMFNGMSQEQVYRMGQSFNTLRFEPDDRMAANFESRLAAMDKDKSAKAARTNAVNALLNMKSEEYPNGRTDLADLVKQGVFSGTDAIKEAIKKTTPTKIQELLGIFNDETNPYNLTDEQRQFGTLNALGASVTKGDLEQKTDLYTKMKEEADAAGTTISPDMLQMFGITKETQSKFDEDWNNLTLFAEQNGMKDAELQEKRLALITGVQPDDGKTPAIRTMEFRAEQAGLIPGTPDYQNFFLNYSGGNNTDIDIDLGVGDGEVNKDYKKKLEEALAGQDIEDIKAVRLAEKNIKKVDQVLAILNAEGAQPNLGYLADFHSTVDRVMADLGLSKEAAKSATYDQRLEALLGSDVFGMINILGIGARGLDTPAERDFLISVMTGTRQLTPDALKEMTLYRRKYSRLVIEEYNKRLADGYYANYQASRPLNPIEVTALEPYQPMNLDDVITPSDMDILKLYNVSM